MTTVVRSVRSGVLVRLSVVVRRDRSTSITVVVVTGREGRPVAGVGGVFGGDDVVGSGAAGGAGTVVSAGVVSAGGGTDVVDGSVAGAARSATEHLAGSFAARVHTSKRTAPRAAERFRDITAGKVPHRSVT